MILCLDTFHNISCAVLYRAKKNRYTISSTLSPTNKKIYVKKEHQGKNLSQFRQKKNSIHTAWLLSYTLFFCQPFDHMTVRQHSSHSDTVCRRCRGESSHFSCKELESIKTSKNQQLLFFPFQCVVVVLAAYFFHWVFWAHQLGWMWTTSTHLSYFF